MRTALAVTIVALLFVALSALSHRDEPAEVTVVDSRATTEITRWTPEQQPPDLGPRFAEWVAAHKPKARARTAPTRRALFNAAYASEVATIVREVFARFGTATVEKALRVFWCESRLIPTAWNGQHVGVAQLARRWQEARANRLGFTWEQMTMARPNLLVAADLYAEQGWGPWECA